MGAKRLNGEVSKEGDKISGVISNTDSSLQISLVPLAAVASHDYRLMCTTLLTVAQAGRVESVFCPISHGCSGARKERRACNASRVDESLRMPCGLQ